MASNLLKTLNASRCKANKPCPFHNATKNTSRSCFHPMSPARSIQAWKAPSWKVRTTSHHGRSVVATNCTVTVPRRWMRISSVHGLMSGIGRPPQDLAETMNKVFNRSIQSLSVFTKNFWRRNWTLAVLSRSNETWREHSRSTLILVVPARAQE